MIVHWYNTWENEGLFFVKDQNVYAKSLKDSNDFRDVARDISCRKVLSNPKYMMQLGMLERMLPIYQ